jgi:tRNA(Ile)-lysidine synthase
LVLFSGGRDSTCLLDVAVRISGKVTALHVNYGLRDDADADQRHCAELCDRLGVELTVVRPDRPDSGNLQAWARDVRYGEAVKRAAGADIAAGHTATDQVETILYRLASSPSRRALLGMRPREGSLIRPLLGVTREQTTAYCTERELRWLEDPSNASRDFARNRIRAELVPALRAIHPAAEQNVLTLASILRDEADVLDALVDEALGGRDEIELARLRDLPGPMRRLVVQRLGDRAAKGPAAGVARRADDVAAMGDTAMLDLPHVRARTERGTLTFESRPSPPINKSD